MEDMKDVIASQPEQIRHSMDTNKEVSAEGKFDSIILAGMGGSGHPGDLLNALQIPFVPLVVHRSYGLPPSIPNTQWERNPLVIPSSYSGNTEEALSSYEEAQKRGYAVLCNTSGGTLEEWSKKDENPIARIDFPGMQPRHTLFASFTGLVTVLANSNLGVDISNDLLRVADTLEEHITALEEPGKEMADKLAGTIPIYTASDTLSFAAKNFKIQTNENAKYPAFWNEFPELNHNEMVGMSHIKDVFKEGSPLHVLMIRDHSDHSRIRARMDVTKDLYEKWGVQVSEFEVKGADLLEKMFYAVVFGLWTTYYLALQYDIDPIPVDGVEDFKKKLVDVAGAAVIS